MKQGRKANISGEKNEKNVTKELKSLGFKIYNYKDIKNNPEIIKKSKYCAVKQYPYETIYDKEVKKENPEYVSKSRMDLRLFNNENNTTLDVECKIQEVAGSADEKFPYSLMNLYSSDSSMSYFLIQGNGFKDKAKLFVKNSIKNKYFKQFAHHEGKIVESGDIENFLEFVMDNFV